MGDTDVMGEKEVFEFEILGNIRISSVRSLLFLLKTSFYLRLQKHFSWWRTAQCGFIHQLCGA